MMNRWSCLIRCLLLVCCVLYGRVKHGSAGTTSSYIRSEFPSTDIPLNSSVFKAPKGRNAPQQVHITQGDYDGKAVIISWVTPREAGESIVRYGTSEKVYDRSAKGKVQNYTYYNYKSGYIHHVLVAGLEYDTKYYYKLGEGHFAREFWFQTPPKVDPDTPYTFGIIGDLGQTYNSLSTLKHYINGGEGDAVLYAGDLPYADWYVGEKAMGLRWDSWGRMVEPSTAYQPWIWSAGNHEIEYEPSVGEYVPFKSYLNRYATPHWASNSSDPLYYAIRRASAHIIVLSSYSPFVEYTPQWIWLQTELANVDREKTPWLIIIVHVPFYNSNEAHYMEGEGMRPIFESWFVEYKVDIVLAGHVHAYERSYRYSNIKYNITNGLCDPIPDESAPVYINIGDGGNREGLASNYTEEQPDYSAFREASYGHAILEIKNRTHAFYKWNRNDDGDLVIADSAIFLNRYWVSNLQKRELKKNHLKSVFVEGIETY